MKGTGFVTRAACGCGAMLFLSCVLKMHAQNILQNSGFEEGSFTNWTSFGPNNYIQAGSPAFSGNNYYKVYGQFNTTTNFTGIYQENPSAPGDIYSADGWAYSASSDNGGIHGSDAVWIEVTFQDASYNALADYRSAVVTGNNIAGFGGLNTWFDLQITNQCSYTNASALILQPGTVTNTVSNLVAPPGTAYVRYQVVFAQGPDNANGSMYFDDMTLNQTGYAPPPGTQWNIVWSDEFNGTSINGNNWTFDTGNNSGWGNQEREYYTNSTNNAYVDGNGFLHIVALQQSMGGFNFTSARMKSEGFYSTPTYGRIQWRAALPAGFGMWPALWMMGANEPTVGWPACGEMDVMENNGDNTAFVQGSLHYGTTKANTTNETAIYDLPSGESTTNFHIYELDWSPTSIQWLVDGNIYETQGNQAVLPFNQPFFFIMNLAVGGDYTGTTNDSAIEASNTFPKEMVVDYVRVYEPTAPLQISATQSNGEVVLSWPTNIVCHLQAQTNSFTSGNWFDLSGTTSPFVVAPSQTGVFYRLESP
jgi:beta-glucanase (GH16 family)